jgi:hypothetical protein
VLLAHTDPAQNPLVHWWLVVQAPPLATFATHAVPEQ